MSMLYPPDIIGGAEKSVALLSEALTERGCTVAAACLSRNKWTDEVVDGVRVFRVPHEYSFWPEEWPNHSLLKRGARKFGVQFNSRQAEHFERVIEEFKPDVINTHSMLDVTTLLWEIAARHNIPIVHTLRDFDLVCANSAMFKNGAVCNEQHLKCKVFSLQKKLHHRHVGAVVGVGKGILEKHLSMGYFSHVPQHLRRVVWNAAVVKGVPANYERQYSSRDKVTFGYLGRINIEKGVGTIIEATRDMVNDDFQVIVAGREPDESKSLIPSAAGLPIDFLGFMDPKEFFSRIDALIVPSIWPEPLPRTVLESYAMSIPVIGSNSGGIPDLLELVDPDLIFKAGDSRSLARVMQQFMKRDRQSLYAKTRYQRVLDETTPEVVAKRYIDIYSELTSN